MKRRNFIAGIAAMVAAPAIPAARKPYLFIPRPPMPHIVIPTSPGIEAASEHLKRMFRDTQGNACGAILSACIGKMVRVSGPRPVDSIAEVA